MFRRGSEQAARFEANACCGDESFADVLAEVAPPTPSSKLDSVFEELSTFSAHYTSSGSLTVPSDTTGGACCRVTLRMRSPREVGKSTTCPFLRSRDSVTKHCTLHPRL